MVDGMEAAQSINHNENTASIPEPISKSGGESVSFDDLEAIQSLPRYTENEKPKESKPKTEGKDSVPNKHERASDVSDKKDKSKPGDKISQEKTEQAYKVFKAKLGEEVLDLRGDSLLEVPVSGKTETVSLEDLQKNYSGKTDWEKKYSGLAKEKQEFIRDRSTLQSAVGQLHEMLIQKGDVLGTIAYLAESLGGDPGKAVAEFKQKLDQVAEERMRLSPEERKAADLAEENQILRGRDEQRKKANEHEQTAKSMRARVDKVLSDADITEAEFFELYQAIYDSGKVPLEQLSPEYVLDQIKHSETQEALVDVVAEVNPDLNDAEKTQAVSELAQIMKQFPDLGVKEMQEIATEVYGSKAAKNLSRKIKKTEPANTAAPSKERKKDPVTFDDLD